MRRCVKCGEGRARPGKVLCAACAGVAEDEAAHMEPGRYQAQLTKARRAQREIEARRR